MKTRPRIVTGLSLAAIAALASLAWSGISKAQFFGGSFGSPVPVARGAGANNVISSDAITVAVAKSNDVVWAYSKHTGAWKKALVKNPAKKAIDPILSERVACFSFGNDVFAFSADTGDWDVAHLDAPADPVVLHDWARVEIGTKLFAFSAKTGKWAMVDIAAD